MAKKVLKKSYKKPPTVKWGKSKTVQGDSQELDKIVTGYKSGYYPATALDFNIDVNLKDLTEDQFDMPDLDEYTRLDPIEQLNVRNNIRALENKLKATLEIQKKEYDDHQKSLENPKPTPDPEPEPIEPGA